MESPVLYYDGDCGLCDRTVRWCLQHDRASRISCAPLQGVTFAAHFPGSPVLLDSLILSENDRLYRESDAVLKILHHLGGHWARLATVAKVIPRPVRDATYRLVARHRKRFFGGPERCQIPDAAAHPQLLP